MPDATPAKSVCPHYSSLELGTQLIHTSSVCKVDAPSFLPRAFSRTCVLENIPVSLHHAAPSGPPLHWFYSHSVHSKKHDILLVPSCSQPTQWGDHWLLPVSLRLVQVEGTPFPSSTQEQAPSNWESSHQPSPKTAPSLPATFGGNGSVSYSVVTE